MDFYGRHTYAYERDANLAQALGREQEEAVGDENVDDKDRHDLADPSSSVANEELEKEEMRIEVKEVEDVPVEESFLFKELEPFTPPILSLGCLCKGLMNMPSYEKYFQDLITYRRKLETLEFG
ncbi:hypothetical protein QYF36_026273 [Acer negundo]|nr:hypothetical protein QYF36_026273 [Acer negundo]